MEPMVSIVVPVYKVEAYLKRCVASLTAQSYHNIEIVLVDDGSPDNSGALCDELALTDPRIRVFHKSNGGLSDARNYGTAQTRGEFVTYIDSDDFVASDYVSRLVELAIRFDADIACCDFVRTTEDQATYERTEEGVEHFTGREACALLMGRLYMPLVIACCKLYKRQILLDHPFPKGMVHEDEAMTCQFLYAAKHVAVCRDQLYAYYVNPGSITEDGVTSSYQKRLLAIIQRAVYFDHVGERRLADQAWSIGVRYLIDIAIAQKAPVRKLVLPYIREHGLFFRMDSKTTIKLMLGLLAPKLLKKD